MYLSEYKAGYRLVDGSYNRVYTRVSLKRPCVKIDDKNTEAIEQALVERIKRRWSKMKSEAELRLMARSILTA